MRLTLRNLLAYLHGTLSPEHQAAFVKLVNDNPRVQLLVNRCQQLATRRLQAPDLEQTALQFQVETVAKYLDFTLPDEQIAAFEKAALASDEQLAEIVAAHRILADVIKQRVPPATPAASFRDRLLNVRSVTPASATSAAAASRPAKPLARSNDDTRFAPVTTAVRDELQDSGDLSEYLSDVDDEEELSLDVVESRARAAEERALAVAAQAYTASRSGAPLSAEAIHAAGIAQDAAYEREALTSQDYSAPPNRKRTLSPAILAAIGVAICLVIGLAIWLALTVLGN